MNAQALLELADDELILGWRDSEWTGIAPFLEEDVAFSSIAQTEIGHARAWYELAARELDADPDALAFDRDPDEYRCAPLVELRLVGDWARTIARRWLYEAADALRIEELKGSDQPDVAGLAARIDREEAYHRMHAEMWADRLRQSPERGRFEAAVEELWPYSLGVLPDSQRETFSAHVTAVLGRDLSLVEAVERGIHTDDLTPLWEEMTTVRRSIPGAAW